MSGAGVSISDRIEVLGADITTLSVDAIVNAANEQLAPGGGVCGAIHGKAGPALARACREMGNCPTGEARITPGFELPAKFIIHAVGPVWQGGGSGEDALLASAYRTSLQLAAGNGLTSIAFPAISTGIYGFPADRAAKIAVETCVAFLEEDPRLARVVLCCFGAESLTLHKEALEACAP